MYVNIAVALPVEHLYTYHVPEEFRDEVAVGKRALIPFGRKYVTGYIVEITDTSEREETKEMLDVIDAEPVVTAPILRLTKWMAEYYFCSWGMAIKAALPAGIDTIHAIEIRLNAAETSAIAEDFFQIEQPRVFGETQRAILKTLRARHR